MRAVNPHVEVPGDNDDKIMARSGQLLGMSDVLALWRFGFLPDSTLAKHNGVCMNQGGFLWVLAFRRTGKVKEQVRGFYASLPGTFVKVLDWEPM